MKEDQPKSIMSSEMAARFDLRRITMKGDVESLDAHPALEANALSLLTKINEIRDGVNYNSPVINEQESVDIEKSSKKTLITSIQSILIGIGEKLGAKNKPSQKGQNDPFEEFRSSDEFKHFDKKHPKFGAALKEMLK